MPASRANKSTTAKPRKGARPAAARQRRRAAAAGTQIRPQLSNLRLDNQNPRLPETLVSADQPTLRAYIEKEYKPIEVARSIAEFGYFPSEPVIVMRQDSSYVVLEGNRRLVALQLLADESLIPLDSVDVEEWHELSQSSDLSLQDAVPAILTSSRKDVAPIIGYRHISGIEQWDAFAKARFVARFVDGEKMNFAEVASHVGGPQVRARERYRNYQILVQARKSFGIDTSLAEDEFGSFTRAMNEAGIQSFLGVPALAEVRAGVPPVPSDRRREVAELLAWLFGNEAERKAPLFTDTRHVRELGMVLQSTDGVRVLRETADLNAALAASGGLKVRLKSNLQHALNDLAGARLDISAYGNEEDIKELLAECDAALRELVEISA